MYWLLVTVNRKLYSLEQAVRDVVEHKLGLLGVQDVRLDNGGPEPVFFYEMKNLQILYNIQDFSYIKESCMQLKQQSFKFNNDVNNQKCNNFFVY